MRIIKFLVFIHFFFILLLATGFGSAYPISTIGNQMKSTSSFSSELCENGQDIVIQVAPFGCSPLRTDLLEDQDVTVYCKLQAMKINPLVNVKSIDSISFTNKNYSPQISSVSFFPANAFSGNKEVITSSTFNDIGYLAVTIKRQTNHSLIPEILSGNLTANVKYLLDNEFGIGKTSFYLRNLGNEDEEKQVFSFWDNTGYLKLESSSGDKAEISVNSLGREIKTVSLKKGETSNKIVLPTSQCGSGLTLKLQELNALTTTVKLQIDSETLEVAKGEKFLNNKCQVKDIINNGLSKEVKISCKDNEGSKEIVLAISPKINLSINEEVKSYELGERIDALSSDQKDVFLIYLDTKQGSKISNENLVIFLLEQPESLKTKLSPAELVSYTKVLKVVSKEEGINPGLLANIGSGLQKFGNNLAKLADSLFKGKKLYTLKFGESIDILDKKISISSLAGAEDAKFKDDTAKSYYEKSFNDYQKLIDDFQDNSYELSKGGDEITYGEKALRSQIFLANSAGQKASAYELCNKFKDKYPTKEINECKENKVLNSKISETYLTIDGENRRFSLEGVYEPDFRDYGVKIKVLHDNQEFEFSLEKGEAVSFPKLDGHLILQEIKDENKAVIFFSLDNKDSLKKLREDLGLVSDQTTLEKNIPKYSDQLGYTFVITEINFDRSAKVILDSSSANIGSKTNFSFKIEIEDRFIQLSPEMTNKTINTLEKLTTTLTGISNFLESWVEIQTGACYLTAGALTLNTFFQGNTAGFNARQTVMRATDGWFEKCNNLVENGNYASLSACLLDKSDTIDKQVEEVTQAFESQQKNIDSLTSSTKPSSIENQEKLITAYCIQVQALLNSLKPEILNQIKITNDDISSLTLDNWKIGKFTLEQLKSIGSYANILKQDSASSKEFAIKELASIFDKIRESVKLEASVSSFFSKFVNEDRIIQDLSENHEIKIYSPTKIVELEQGLQTQLVRENVDTNDYVQAVYNIRDNKKYILVIASAGLSIKNTYVLNEAEQLQLVNQEDINPLKLNVKLYVKFEYNNKYENPELKYYDSEPYKGLPAIVPIDVNEGWYVVIKQVTSSLGNIASYDDSGNVRSFYLGNVGPNHKFEFEINGADDTYKSINLDAPTSPSFPGLTTSETNALVSKAREAIKQAQAIKESKRTGKVKINGQEVNIGQAAASTIQMSCEDVLSPKECTILYNVCDPVICPASRCDLFGNYKNNPQNVKQKGVLGGITFCLGNFVGFGGDVAVPLCLDGIKAGIDYIISAANETSKCLKTSLETGETVGVCDEVQSIYLCQALWKEADSLVGLVDLGFNLLTDKNKKQGGEYFNLQEQVALSKNTMDFFLNSYSSEMQKSFLSRTTKEIGAGICKSFVSGVFPSFSDMVSQVVKSESPVQFTGHFEEIPFTTATYPAISQYKVSYHIYSGKDSATYYSIYLKGSENSISTPDKLVDSGSIEIGGSLTNSKDFTAPAGYKQLCINVNGQEECGFKQVSTSFSVDAVKEMYVSNQAGKTDILTEKACRSGTIAGYGTEIYNRGIIRECSTDNPGIGTDPYINTENSRWKDVGYCDSPNVRCWIDSESVKDVLEFNDLEEQALGEITQSDLDALGLDGDYITSITQLENKLKEIMLISSNNIEDLKKKITLIDEIIDRVVISEYKMKLLLLRGDAYRDLFGLYQKIQPQVKEEEKEEEKASIPPDLSQIRKAILKSAKELDGTSANRRLSQLQITNLNELLSTLDDTKRIIQADIDNLKKIYENAPLEPTATCSDATAYVYSKAKGEFINVLENYEFPNGATPYLFYSDKYGTEYTIKLKENKEEKIEIKNNYPFRSYPDSSPYTNKDQDYDTEQEKLDSIEPGDILDLFSDTNYGHSVIFIGWKDKPNRIAQLFDWNNNKKILSESGNPIYWYTDKNSDDLYYLNKKFRYFSWDISDDSHPVYVIYKPEQKNETAVTGDSATGSPGTVGGSGEYAPLDEEGDASSKEIPIPSSNQNLAQNLEQEKTEVKNNKISISSFNDLLEKSGIKTSDNKKCGNNIVNTESLALCLRSDSNFKRINPEDLHEGDIILLGNNCNLDAISGIVKEVNFKGDRMELTYYNFIPHFIGSGVDVQEISKEEVYIDKIDSIQNKNYLHAAYRYIKDDKEDYFKAYTASEAINDLKSYSENIKISSNTQVKSIFDKLVISDIIHAEQCSQVKDKNVKWLRELLGVLDLSEIDFKSDPRYIEVSPQNIKVGDIILLRIGCDFNTEIGKVTSVGERGSDGRMIIKYDWSKNSQKQQSEVNLIRELAVNGEFIYKAYRLKEELTSTEIDSLKNSLIRKWTKESAYNKLSDWTTPSKNNGNDYSELLYSDNNLRPIIDQFIIDEVFTSPQCIKITGINNFNGFLGKIWNVATALLNGGMKVKDIKSLLEEEIGASNLNSELSIPEKILKELEVREKNQQSTDSMSTIFNGAGLNFINKNSGTLDTIKSISQSSDFSKINPSLVKEGDILFLGEGCLLEKEIGVVKSLSPDRKIIYFYAPNKKNNLIKSFTTTYIQEIDYTGTSFFVYAAYRYNKGLNSYEQKDLSGYVDKVTHSSKEEVISQLKSLIKENNNKDLTYLNSKNTLVSKKFRILFGEMLSDKIITSRDCDNLLTSSTASALTINQVIDYLNGESSSSMIYP